MVVILKRLVITSIICTCNNLYFGLSIVDNATSYNAFVKLFCFEWLPANNQCACWSIKNMSSMLLWIENVLFRYFSITLGFGQQKTG